MGNFYTPDEVRPLFGEIAPAYQMAFAGPPWNEVSKCADESVRCVGGLSALALGSQCDTCGLCPTRQAYEADELIERFEGLASSRPTAWYAEENDEGVTLAAVAWKATPSVIAQEKYSDVPTMQDWIKDSFSAPYQRLARRVGFHSKEPQIMWLDEVFANRQIKPKGNLQNFGRFVVGLAEVLDCELVAYRTIEPRMTAVAQRDFKGDAAVFKRNGGVPDRRDFVIINTMDVVEDGCMTPSEGIMTVPYYKKVRKQI